MICKQKWRYIVYGNKDAENKQGHGKKPSKDHIQQHNQQKYKKHIASAGSNPSYHL